LQRSQYISPTEIVGFNGKAEIRRLFGKWALKPVVHENQNKGDCKVLID
jgi:hypothetical protein